MFVLHCFPTFRRTHNGLCPSHTIFLTERRDGRALFTTDQYTAGLAECRHLCTAKGREVEGTPELKGRGLGCGHNARFRHANTKHSLEHVVVKGLLPSAMVVHPMASTTLACVRTVAILAFPLQLAT